MSSQIDFLAGGLEDANGDPYNGVTVEFYEAGTATPLEVFSDAALTSSLGTSTTLDSYGRKLVFYDPTTSVKVVLKAATGDQTWDGLQYAENLGENYIKPDGSVAMTGAFDLDGNNVTNAGDINMASGSSIIFKVGGAWSPGASDMLVMGGASGYWAMRGDDSLTIYDDGTLRATLNSSGKLILTDGLTLSGKIDGLTAGSATGEAVEYDQMNTALGTRDTNLNNHIADTSTHGITSTIAGLDEVQTFTNKTLTSPTINTPTITSPTITGGTIDASSTTITNIDVADFASGVLDTDLSDGTSAADDTLASAKAIKTYVDDYLVTAVAGSVSDDAYAAGWNGVVSIAPSKNAVYDKIESIDASVSAIPSQFACWNQTLVASTNGPLLGTGIDTSDTTNATAASFTLRLTGSAEAGFYNYRALITKNSGTANPTALFIVDRDQSSGVGAVSWWASTTMADSTQLEPLLGGDGAGLGMYLERDDTSNEMCFRIIFSSSWKAVSEMSGILSFAGTAISPGQGTKL